jgi:hypothetical protein
MRKFIFHYFSLEINGMYLRTSESTRDPRCAAQINGKQDEPHWKPLFHALAIGITVSRQGNSWLIGI